MKIRTEATPIKQAPTLPTQKTPSPLRKSTQKPLVGNSSFEDKQSDQMVSPQNNTENTPQRSSMMEFTIHLKNKPDPD